MFLHQMIAVMAGLLIGCGANNGKIEGTEPSRTATERRDADGKGRTTSADQKADSNSVSTVSLSPASLSGEAGKSVVSDCLRDVYANVRAENDQFGDAVLAPSELKGTCVRLTLLCRDNSTEYLLQIDNLPDEGDVHAGLVFDNTEAVGKPIRFDRERTPVGADPGKTRTHVFMGYQGIPLSSDIQGSFEIKKKPARVGDDLLVKMDLQFTFRLFDEDRDAVVAMQGYAKVKVMQDDGFNSWEKCRKF